jgi:ribosomal protein S12 methylthiotransferase
MKNTVKTRNDSVTEKPKVGLIALGCEKNRIDAEIMLAALENDGCEICPDENECDVIIVHTCAFIDKAKEESIENILSAAEQKKTGKCKKLIVTGCLAERYRSEIFESIPEVDAVLGSKSFDKITEAVKSVKGKKYEHYRSLDKTPPSGQRVLSSPDYSVYLKIAEGCSNHCSYCVIPMLRGEFMPRKFADVVSEAEALAANGAVEINLIAQDTTAYPDLCRLVRRIAQIETVKWIRILYFRPEEITDEMIELFATEKKLVKYMDIPLQHASEHVLKLMNRPMSDGELKALVANLRAKIPGVSLRTTFITGFPHETEEDFEILCNFVKEARFNNLGVFTYSREEGTKAGRMHGQIDEETKQRRADIVMDIQNTLLESINGDFTGKTFEVLCEGYDEEKELYTGRAYFQAPDIDGRVYFSSDDPAAEGKFYNVRLDVYDSYDFYGKAVI